MSQFRTWCDRQEEKIGDHLLVVLKTDKDRTAIGVKTVARELPQHYMSGDRHAEILERLGKSAAAQYLRSKLPETKSTRSGELGEILAISYVEKETPWNHAVKKLRWKDHREMPMRGDDFIAINCKDNKIRFLKGESKSRVRISKSTLKKARKTLSDNNERPTPHTLAFLSDRLAEEGQKDIADRITDAQYRDSISIKQVSHMIFSFSANDPKDLLKADLLRYSGEARQFSVALQIKTHQDFIKDVYDKVISDGNA